LAATAQILATTVIGIGSDSTNDFGTPYATITPPRTLGVEVRAEF